MEVLCGELERLFSLDEMTGMSRNLLGLDPADVGGTGARASFARALAERCAADGDRIDALVDCVLALRGDVDPRVQDVPALLGAIDLPHTRNVGPFVIERTIGRSASAVVYLTRTWSRF